MEYRYPPVTYLLLYPLRWMPLRVAGFFWMLAAWITVVFTVTLAIRVRQLRFNWGSIVACCALMLAYLVLAVRYGNVQPFVIAWIFAALILSETRPLWAGFLLALAVTFKIWPILFLPWLFHRARLRSAVFFAIFFVALWILPAPIFGVARYWSLLQDWYTSVSRVGTTYSEFYYFPGQSLRGLLLRFLSPVAPPLKNFPDIHVLSLSPRTAVVIWVILGAAIYSFFVLYMLRSDVRKLWAWDGLAFVLYSLLEPYAVKSGLISLGPAALTAACLYTIAYRKHPPSTSPAKIANKCFLTACLLSFIGAIVQYKPWQRFLLSIGLDFWAGASLLAALFIWIVNTGLAESCVAGKLATAPSGPPAHTAPTTAEAQDKPQASISGSEDPIRLPGRSDGSG